MTRCKLSGGNVLSTDMKHQNINQMAVNTIRFLSADGVQKANSGHPGMPMGMADCAFVLWSRFLNFNPADPRWPNRDRFVLSAGHGSMLIYSMLHLSGYDLKMEDLKQFRQWESKTPGHPEYGDTPGIETTTGPLGQGISNAIGMALASKMMAARFNRDEIPIVDHKVYGICGDGDQMEGISSEAASLAGHLRLGNIIFIYDDNEITIEGKTSLSFSEDVGKRYEAYGWHIARCDGHNHEEIARAIESGIAETGRPTLIIAKSHIGFGSPNKQDTADVHGSPLGDEELDLAKQKLGWPVEPRFFVPEEVRVLFRKRVEHNQKIHRTWCQQFDQWRKKYSDLAEEWDSMMNKSLPDDLEKQLMSVLPDKPAATRAIGGKVLNKAAELIPGLAGGSADLAPSTKTLIGTAASVSPGEFDGRNLHFGIREHGMGGILNGMSLYGGIIPYGSTFLVFSDYMRPAIRLAAIMKTQVIYVFTHDSIFVGEDGPTHQPVEHVAALRAIPHLWVYRPADGVETAIAWAHALKRADGPTAICLTRQTVPVLERSAGFQNSLMQRGGYILSDTESPDVILVGTGSEVGVAVDAKIILEKKGIMARVVSMPCLDIFQEEDQAYQTSVITPDIPVAVIEAGVVQGWHGITRSPLLFIGMNRFGASAPASVLAEKFGFNGPAAAEMVECWINAL